MSRAVPGAEMSVFGRSTAEDTHKLGVSQVEGRILLRTGRQASVFVCRQPDLALAAGYALPEFPLAEVSGEGGEDGQ